MAATGTKIIFIVPKFEYVQGGVAQTDEWEVAPGTAQLDGATGIDWYLADNKPHTLKIILPVGPFSAVKVSAGMASATVILPAAERGKNKYYPYQVFVDDRPAHGGSAPGMIVD
jgi:hypothetical protein